MNSSFNTGKFNTFVIAYFPCILISAVYLGISLILRVILYIAFGQSAGVTIVDLFSVLVVGAVNDSVQLIYLLIPYSLYLLVVPDSFFKTGFHKYLSAIILYLIVFGMLYLGAVEYFFFDEFSARLNLVAVDYLLYPYEVFINIWESYPVARFLTASFVLAGIIFSVVRRKINEKYKISTYTKKALPFFAAHIAILLLIAFTFSSDSLSFSSNRITNEIAGNGISSLFRAFRTQHLDYDLYYKTVEKKEAYSNIREELVKYGGTYEDDIENLERSIKADPGGLGKMNVVLIVEESFGSKFVGVLGGEGNLTPKFDKLSKRGMLFKNLYATGTRTVRGLEAITTSFPPIPSVSIIKRPGNEGIANWGTVMKNAGYHVSFLYGGYGYFDNMNYFFENNDFVISDRMEIENQTFANIWGVCDQDLFNHALSYYDKVAASKKPFFSLIMTTSNHKPFTFPEGIEGIPAKGGWRDAGIKYADYSMGEFIDKASSHSWFKNTIFVIVADHDARVYGRDKIPMKRYKIPLLILSPGNIKPEVSDLLMSQIDIAPTVLGLLGIQYKAPFFGHDIFSPAQKGKPSSVLVSHNHNVAFYKDETLVVFGLNKDVDFYKYDDEKDLQIQTEPNDYLETLGVSYYQTAFDSFRRHTYVMN